MEQLEKQTNTSEKTIKFLLTHFYFAGATSLAYTALNRYAKMTVEVFPSINHNDEFLCRAMCEKLSYVFPIIGTPCQLAIGTWSFEVEKWLTSLAEMNKIFTTTNVPIEMEVSWSQWKIVSPALGISLPASIIDEFY